MKRCSISLTSMEMQIKISMRYCFTSVWKGIIKKRKDKCWKGCEEKRTIMHCWSNVISSAIMENWMEVPPNIKNRTTIWSTYPTSGYICKRKESVCQRDACTFIYITALFALARIWNQPKCLLMDEWIKKMWDIYI